jgi:hypothetical protein
MTGKRPAQIAEMPSTPSHSYYRVEPLQFDASIGGGELPIGFGVMGVASAQDADVVGHDRLTAARSDADGRRLAGKPWERKAALGEPNRALERRKWASWIQSVALMRSSMKAYASAL